MSDSNGPIRRRRIAGESTPAAAKKSTAKQAPAAKKAAAKKATAKKVPAAKKAPAKAAPTKKATAAGKAPTAKVATAKSVATRPAPKKAPSAPRPEVQSGAAGPSRRDLRWLVPAALVAIASLVVGGLLAFQGLQDIRDDDGGRASTEKEASSAASAAVETIFSSSYDKLDEHLSDSTKLMTSTFAKDFTKVDPAFRDTATKNKTQIEAVVRNAAALSCGDECSPGTVEVLIFFDQARLIAGSTDPSVTGNRIRVKMVHRDNEWLVDDMRVS